MAIFVVGNANRIAVLCCGWHAVAKWTEQTGSTLVRDSIPDEEGQTKKTTVRSVELLGHNAVI